MIRMFVIFAVLSAVIGFVARVWSNQKGKQKWRIMKALAFGVACSSVAMVILFVLGFSFLAFNWIMNPSMWDNVQFGIYDTLGT